MEIYIVSDIGGTQMRVAAHNTEDLSRVNVKKIPTLGEGQTPTERLIQLIREVSGENRIRAIAVAAPGYLDPEKGIVYLAPNIPGWRNLNLRQHLYDVFRVPVYLGNDANMAALGEWKFGAGIHHRNLLYLTISTGIGSGVVLDNRLLLGENGLAAEFGHVTIDPEGPLCGCGHRGHLEAYASGTGITNFVRQQLSAGVRSSLSLDNNLSSKEINQAAQLGDSLAIQAFTRAGKYLGIAIANFLHMLNPSIVILGGGVTQAGDLLFTPMHQALQESIISPQYLKNLKITTAVLGDDVGLKGALALLITEFCQPIQNSSGS
ncbi:MAG: sugar kinase [Anaerolineaceae bacterium]|nr:sugar kinase [Anaerolineaceae bacterium]